MYVVTSEMCRSNSLRDVLRIAISNTEVTVFGRPFEAATGEVER